MCLSVVVLSAHLSYIDSAVSYNGTREIKQNRGYIIDKFNYSVNNPLGSPYCGAFVGYCLIVNNVEYPKPSGLAVNYYYHGFKTFSLGKVLQNKAVPKYGDIFIMKRGNTIKGHTGFILSYDAKTRTIATIEANTNNTGSREGDGVYIKKRKLEPYNFFGIIGFSKTSNNEKM